MRRVIGLAGLAAVVVVLGAYLLFGTRDPGDGARARTRGWSTPSIAIGRDPRITIARAGAPPFSLVRQPPGQEPAWRERPGDGRWTRRPSRTCWPRSISPRRRARRTSAAAAAGLAPPRVALELDGRAVRSRSSSGVATPPGRGVRARRWRAGNPRGAAAAGRARRSRALGVSRSAAGPAAARRDHGDQLAGRRARWRRSVACAWSRAAGGRTAGAISGSPASGWPRACAVSSDCASSGSSPAARAPAPARGSRSRSTAVHGPPVAPGRRLRRPAWSARRTRRARPARTGPVWSPEALGDLWPLAGGRVGRPIGAWSRHPRGGDARRDDGRAVTRRLILARRCQAAPGGSRTPRWRMRPIRRLIGDWLAALRERRGRGRRRPARRRRTSRRLTIDGRTRETVARRAGRSRVRPGQSRSAPFPGSRRARLRPLRRARGSGARRRRRPSSSPAPTARAGGWSRRPARRPDRTNAARVVGALGNLRAEAFSAEAPAGAPELNLEVAVQPPGEAAPTRHTLEIDKKKEAPGCTGRLDRDVAFALAPAACDELRLGLLK